MNWREKYADKMRSVEDAVGLVKSGDRVYVGMFTSSPETLTKALFARKDELTNVDIYHYVAPFVWSLPETVGHFRLVTGFTTPADRRQVHAGIADYLPLGNFRESYIKDVMSHVNVALVKTSPPDEHGYMSFGTALWANRTVCDVAAPNIVCEVDERLIRTFVIPGICWISLWTRCASWLAYSMS